MFCNPSLGGAPTRRLTAVLVGCRLLDVVDDEDIDRAFRRFQLESKLFLKGREE
jgi:hypothetical protein